MIAVFSRKIDFDDLVFLPKENFKHICEINDLRGRKFTGLILIFPWSKDYRQVQAYDELKRHQPELFK